MNMKKNKVSIVADTIIQNTFWIFLSNDIQINITNPTTYPYLNSVLKTFKNLLYGSTEVKNWINIFLPFSSTMGMTEASNISTLQNLYFKEFKGWFNYFIGNRIKSHQEICEEFNIDTNYWIFLHAILLQTRNNYFAIIQTYDSKIPIYFYLFCNL